MGMGPGAVGMLWRMENCNRKMQDVGYGEAEVETAVAEECSGKGQGRSNPWSSWEMQMDQVLKPLYNLSARNRNVQISMVRV